jgi:hypothetical protein
VFATRRDSRVGACSTRVGFGVDFPKVGGCEFFCFVYSLVSTVAHNVSTCNA